MRDAALRAVEQADVVVLVKDVADNRPAIDPGRRVDLVIIAQVDKVNPAAGVAQRHRVGGLLVPCIALSALSGQGIASLLERLDELAFGGSGAVGSQLALNARHVGEIEAARQALGAARDHLDDGAEIVALDLREALDALGCILGAVTPDDVLGRIFSRFCIGK
jgi:tRNA modification GTPase